MSRSTSTMSDETRTGQRIAIDSPIITVCCHYDRTHQQIALQRNRNCIVWSRWLTALNTLSFICCYMFGGKAQKVQYDIWSLGCEWIYCMSTTMWPTWKHGTLSAITSNCPMTIIQVPDGGDMMGCSVESAHRDVMHQSQLDPNAWKLLTKKFCVSGNIHGQLYRNVGQCSSHE